MGNHRRHAHHDLREIARRAMVQKGFLPEFSAEIWAEVEAMTPAGLFPAARDLRDLLWCSIDNDDSRDLDQLTIAETIEGDGVKVMVAIADVDETVRRSSIVDGHAANNTTSVYTAAGVFPMLPPRLSTDLTSLSEGEDRVALVMEMVIDREGALDGSDIYRALVRNHAKLAYKPIAAWLEGTGPAPAKLDAVPGLGERVHLQDRAAQRLQELRYRHGALSLQTEEARPVFEGETLTGLEAERHSRANQLIENLMIAGNEVAVRYLREKGFPSVRRVLRSPDRWGRIVELAAGYHEALPPEPDSRALQEFLTRRQAADPTGFADLSLTIVKLMGKGEYVPVFPGADVGGHFGLAVSDYTHSTAPNRRYPDLVTQRLLKAAMAGQQPPYTREELVSLAQHCTTMEDAANKVERQVMKSAAALLLEHRRGESFEALVTGASPKGTWVRIFAPPVEGRLVQGFAGLDVGDRVKVKLVGADVERGFIDFSR